MITLRDKRAALIRNLNSHLLILFELQARLLNSGEDGLFKRENSVQCAGFVINRDGLIRMLNEMEEALNLSKVIGLPAEPVTIHSIHEKLLDMARNRSTRLTHYYESRRDLLHDSGAIMGERRAANLITNHRERLQNRSFVIVKSLHYITMLCDWVLGVIEGDSVSAEVPSAEKERSTAKDYKNHTGMGLF